MSKLTLDFDDLANDVANAVEETFTTNVDTSTLCGVIQAALSEHDFVDVIYTEQHVLDIVKMWADPNIYATDEQVQTIRDENLRRLAGLILAECKTDVNYSFDAAAPSDVLLPEPPAVLYVNLSESASDQVVDDAVALYKTQRDNTAPMPEGAVETLDAVDGLDIITCGTYSHIFINGER